MSKLPDCCYRVSIKALILNETRNKFLVSKDHGYWDLPGGGVSHGTVATEELAREIKEEMGLAVTWIDSKPSYFATGVQTLNPEVPMASVIYECELEHLDFTPSEECTDIMFVSPDEINSLPVFDAVKKLAVIFRKENH